jgi:hypothetical protein
MQVFVNLKDIIEVAIIVIIGIIIGVLILFGQFKKK